MTWRWLHEMTKSIGMHSVTVSEHGLGFSIKGAFLWPGMKLHSVRTSSNTFEIRISSFYRSVIATMVASPTTLRDRSHKQPMTNPIIPLAKATMLNFNQGPGGHSWLTRMPHISQLWKPAHVRKIDQIQMENLASIQKDSRGERCSQEPARRR